MAAPVEDVESIYKALADGHRRRILAALCERPTIAGDLGRLVGLAPNAVSFHLRWLRSAGLVSVKREGRFLRYQANPEPLTAWKRHVESSFETEAVGEGTIVSVRWSEQPGLSPDGGTAAAHPAEPDPSADELLPTELL